MTAVSPDLKTIINLSGIYITIIFTDSMKMVKRQCDFFFRDFRCPDRKSNAEIIINTTACAKKRSAVFAEIEQIDVEQVLSHEKAIQWFHTYSKNPADISLTEKTLCSYYKNGVVLFNPDTVGATIYFRDASSCNFRVLHRLLWICFAQILGEKGCCFLHAAALVKNDRAYLFPGNSGAGKSTIAGLCPGYHVYSDDSPVFCNIRGEYLVYPSPYRQINLLEGLDTTDIKSFAQVHSIYFLQKDKRTFLEPVSRKTAFPMMINQHILFFSHLSPSARSVLFDLFFELCDTVPKYYLHFRKNRNVLNIITENKPGGHHVREKKQNSLRTAPAF